MGTILDLFGPRMWSHIDRGTTKNGLLESLNVLRYVGGLGIIGSPFSRGRFDSFGRAALRLSLTTTADPCHPVQEESLLRPPITQGPSHETLDSQPRRLARTLGASQVIQVPGSLSGAL